MNLVDLLRLALAETWAYYFKAHSFHWNVRGPLFRQFHDLFSDLYSDLHGAVDDLAEKVRTLNELAPADPEAMIAGASIRFTAPPSAPEMVVQLLEANMITVEALTKANIAAIEAGNDGLSNYLQGRLDAHAKWGWMLRATISDDVAPSEGDRA